MGSALLNTDTELELARGGGDVDNSATGRPAPAQSRVKAARVQPEPAASVPETVEEIRQQVAERLAAHRRRRGIAQAQPEAEPARPADSRSAKIAAAVAERYAHTPSYRAVLAAEGERAIQQARAAAEVAALNAQAIAAAQQRLLDAFDEQAMHEEAAERELPQTDGAARADERAVAAAAAAIEASVAVELELWPDLDPDLEPVSSPARRARAARREMPAEVAKAHADEASLRELPAPAAGLTVRLYEDAASAAHAGFASAPYAANMARAHRRGYGDEWDRDEASALDEEIAFRHAPVFEEPAGPPVPLPANLIEFPRQLVAARKARPRYAEGPLRDEAEPEPGDGQLRIFEVDPAQISTSPLAESAPVPQWTSIWLDGVAAGHASATELPAEEAMELPPSYAPPAIEAAPIARRAAAGAIDLAIVLAAMAGFAAASMWAAAHATEWRAGLPAAASMRQIASAIAAQTDLGLRGAGTIVAASGVFLLALYHALFAWLSDATPGMRSVRIALCTFDDENPTRRATRRRMIAAVLSACPLGLGFAWAALDEDRLTWHDRITRMYLRRY